MRVHFRCVAIGLSMVIAACCGAKELPRGCNYPDVTEHVREQVRHYLPLSERHEYFGFVYVHEGRVASAVAKGRTCPDPRQCWVSSRAAVAGIPRKAKVLGEWHTHPKGGSRVLSEADVRGAYANRRIHCYAAFYATTDGGLYRWDPAASSVPVAMASRERVDALDQPNGLSIDGGGSLNQMGFSSPM